jgi:hypothetical protein
MLGPCKGRAAAGAPPPRMRTVECAFAAIPRGGAPDRLSLFRTDSTRWLCRRSRCRTFDTASHNSIDIVRTLEPPTSRTPDLPNSPTPEPPNPEPRTPELPNPRTPEPPNPRTPELPNSRTPEPPNPRTPEPSNPDPGVARAMREAYSGRTPSNIPLNV